MPATSHAPAESASASGGCVAQSQLIPVRSRRRPWLLGLGTMLSALGVLVVVWLVGAAGQRQEVLVVARPVDYGKAIAAEDLTVARVSVDPGVRVLPASARAGLVGQTAATRLVPGMLITQGMAEPAGEPGPGRLLVPVALASERMPAGGLRAGDRVLAVNTEDAAGRSLYSAAVVRVGTPDVNGVTVVDLTVAMSDGAALAVAAAKENVAIVVRPNGD